MKEFIVQSVNDEDEIVEKTKIVIEENDRIILKYGLINNDRPVPKSYIESTHEYFTKCLEDNVKVINLPYFVNIEILKIN